MKYASYYKSASRYLFPSPIGVLYISMDKKTTYDIQLSVSVPYWGSLYFNCLRKIHIVYNFHLFPSPIGVLYISIFIFVTLSRFDKCFRPLLGFFIFQSNTAIILGYMQVSVPYWGSLYFNPVLRSPYNYRAAKPDCGAKPNPAFTI